MNDSTDSPGDWRETLGQLLRQMVDGKLDPPKHKELVCILESADEAKRYYLSYLQVHTDLGHQWGSDGSPNHIDTGAAVGVAGSSHEPTLVVDSVRPAKDLRGRRGLLPVIGWLAFGLAASLLFVAQVFGPEIRSFVRPQVRPFAINANLPKDTQQPSVDLSVTVQSPAEVDTVTKTESLVSGWNDVAVIVRNDGVADASLQVGKRLSPGVVRFGSGTLQLQFMSGASMVLEGPAELQIESAKTATLLSGTVKTRVNERAKGFILNTPQAAVVDIGTEFGLRFDEGGHPQVEVFEGEVEFSLLGPDGNTLTSRRLLQSEVVGVANGSTGEVGWLEEALPRQDGPQIELPIVNAPGATPEYGQLIRTARPLVYWRFESADNGFVANEMGDQWAAQIVHEAESDPAITVEHGRLQLQRSATPRYVTSIDPIPGLDDSALTIEFWMNPDDLEHSHCVGLAPFAAVDAMAFLSVVEVVTDTFLIHQPGSMRILYRNPPDRDQQFGKNVFSPGMVTPGQWHHVAMVNSDESLDLYLNGELIRSVDSEIGTGKKVQDGFRVILGQLTMLYTMRQFSGAIDEFALYNRALESSEILGHFRAATAVR